MSWVRLTVVLEDSVARGNDCLTKKRKTMGIIIGKEKVNAVQNEKPVEETPVEAVSEAVSEEQKPGEAVAPTEDVAVVEEPKKPVRRTRKRK